MLKLQEIIDYIFNEIPSVYLIVGSTLLFLFMGTMAFIVRTRAGEKTDFTEKNHFAATVHVNRGAHVFI